MQHDGKSLFLAAFVLSSGSLFACQDGAADDGELFADGGTAGTGGEPGGSGGSAGTGGSSSGSGGAGGSPAGDAGSDCQPGQDTCPSGCADLASDPSNCGVCDRQCAPSEVCSAGTCALECGANLARCGQSCIDTSTNALHCGGCNQPCASGQACQGSTCECPDTSPLCDGQCRDTNVDPAHCGSCNNGCASGVCDNGTCTAVTTNGLVGWAATEGRGRATTTGGQGGSVVDVDTSSELASAAGSSEPRIIRISGSITIPELDVRSNKTLVGVGTDATIIGGINIDGESNVIVQNLHINAKTSTAQGDGIHIQGSHHVWVDHCDIWDAPDGNLDITHQSDLVTVSWTRFWYSSSPGDSAHRFSGLIGGNDADPDAGYLNVTFHHNFWAERVLERMPRVRYGKVHVFNNYFRSAGNNHCVRAAYQSNVRIENNYFEDVNNPHEIDSDTGTGTTGTAIVSASGNTYDGTSGSRTTRGTAFTPPYAYQAQPASVIPAAVSAGYGPR